MNTFSLICTVGILLVASACEYSRAEAEIDCSVSPVTISISEVGASACDTPDGSFSVQAGGGSGAGFEFSVNGGAFSTEPVFSNLEPLNYSVQARDLETGCTSAVQVVTVPAEGQGCNG
jgi:hypothetical protein